MEPDIKPVRGHYEAYWNGMFICSGDTYNETAREADKYLAERKWCK